ncbi:unnamed protein product [Kuraishia capsulata CBS 1993]|uniref:Fe2OG dioxygenase domain-containing protein n=1 Tax=Kuraishia capsulata CBS 1993 TaxID=1382522 RepID=W6MHR1_9ASCO|nr:uncharacterized protein KUCA_T00001830001 [Kuraishia capsulata CBS 1993]CDK25859.1 unnamed protein product [Kuraishia capsulata CBS 1993]
MVKTIESTVPIIDFGKFLNGSEAERKLIAGDMVKVMREVGFMYLVNHGIAQELINEMFAWSARFFALDENNKNWCRHPEDGAHHRGWSHVGKEKVSQMVFDRDLVKQLRRQPDVKESFDLGNENGYYSNIWPHDEDIPGFREFCNGFFACEDHTAKQLLRAIALGLGLDEEYLLNFHKTSDNQLRLLHYPPTETLALQTGEKERIAAHTDFGTMTMLLQDSCGGLEVEDPHIPGLFIPAPYIPGSIILNTGDFLMRWSNDVLKSTLHRVRAPPIDSKTGLAQRRYSIPYFVGADKDVVVDCLPSCHSALNPKKYESISSREYIAMRLRATY